MGAAPVVNPGLSLFLIWSKPSAWWTLLKMLRYFLKNDICGLWFLLLHNLWRLKMNEGESNFQSNFSFSFKCIFYFKFLLPNGNRWYFSHNSFHYRHIQKFYIVVNTVLQINYSCLHNVSFKWFKVRYTLWNWNHM